MKIEGNQKELDAMVEFHKGNRVEGLLQLQTLGFEHAVHAAIDAVREKDARL